MEEDHKIEEYDLPELKEIEKSALLNKTGSEARV